jgi:hypothetical protein
MTADRFRKIALSLPGAIESAHMNHPDFRAHGRIFATLSEDLKSGMVKLTPELQREFITEFPTMFAPINGTWGKNGATRVHLKEADDEAVGRAMTEAYNLSARPSIKKKQSPKKIK